MRDLVIVALMYADDLEVIAEDEEAFERRLGIVYAWAKKWRMRVNEKKSEAVVFGCKEIVKKKGWVMGEIRIKEVKEATCLGIVFEKGGRREKMFEKKNKKIGMVLAGLKETRRMLGERAALRAWDVFARTVMLFGSEVMVWDTVNRRMKMDVLDRKAMRTILGLDLGGNDQLIYGEIDMNRVSVEAELRALKYGEG